MLVAKQGVCHQCVELSEFFTGRKENPLAGTRGDIDARLSIDIPVKNLERAIAFYGRVLGVSLQPVDKAPVPMAFFPFAPGIASGALVQSKDRRPSDQGTTVYLNGGKDLAGPLSRVEAAGGKVLQAKTAIGEHGFMAYFTDTEGNRVSIARAER